MSQINTIQDLFNYLSGLGSNVTLDSAFLTGRVLDLIKSDLQLDSKSIAISGATTTLSNDQQTVYVAGTSTLLSMDAVAVNALIQLTTAGDGSTSFDLILEMITPTGWTFGTSFPSLAGMQPPDALSLQAGPFLYFSSFAANQPVPVFPGQQPVTPPGNLTPPVLLTGLNYYAQLKPAGIYATVISLISSQTPWFFITGMITPDPDKPTFDLHAPVDQATTVLDYIPGLAPPWLGIRVDYPAPSGGGGPVTDAPKATLVFYLGTSINLTVASPPPAAIPVEIDLIIDTTAKTVTVEIDANENNGLSLADLTTSLFHASSGDLLGEVGTALNPVLDLVKLQQFTATFHAPPTDHILSAITATLDTDVWNTGIPGFPTFQLFLDWQMQFGGADKSSWTLSFGGTATFTQGLAFTVAVDVPDAKGTCTQIGALNLALSDLNNVFGVSLAIPSDLLEVSITNFLLDLEYQKSYKVSATFNASFNLFGAQLLALQDMNVALSYTVGQGGGDSTYQLDLAGNILLGPITVATTATITNDPKVDTVFTMHLVNATVGSILNALVSLVDPSASVTFGEPWDQILNISLDKLLLTVNVSKGTVELSYPVNLKFEFLGITFLELDTLGLVYTKGTATASSKVTVDIQGKFLGQTIGGDNPVNFDALNGSPPDVPKGGTQIFDLQYAGLGQHIAFGNPQNLTTIADVMSAMMASVLPTPTGALPPFGQAGQNGSIVFAADSNWFIGANFTIMKTLTLQAVFNDPNMYGILIALAGEKAGSFAGLSFEILYRKINDSIGVYHIELKLPDAMRNLQFGEVSITLPVIILDVYTNGNFKINFGFPVGLDFSNSFSIQIFPFVGYGGFYFAFLDGSTSSNVPQITNGDWSPVIEFGFALSIGVGKTVNEGVLSGGISVTVVGILQGVLAWFNPSDNSNKEVYYWIQGTIAITGRLYATINFGIIQASLDVTAYASVTLTIQAHAPIYIAISAGVSVRVSLKIVFFTVHFSFSATINASFTIGSATPTPWIVKSGGGGGQTLRAPQGFRAAALMEAAVAAPAMPPGMARAMRKALIAAPATAGAWPDINVMPGGTVVTLNLWALPAFTKDPDGGAAAIMLLAAQTDSNGNASAGTQFNQLLQAMLLWGVNNAIGTVEPTAAITADQLQQLNQQLNRQATIDAAFNYTTLTAFLAANFIFQVTPADGTTPQSVAVFPMIPAITLTDTNGLSVDFGTFNGVNTTYVEKVQAYFELLQIQFEQRQNNQPAAPRALMAEPLIPMAEVVFSQYFNMLMTNAVQAAIDLLSSFPYTTTGTMSIAQIGTAVGDSLLTSQPGRVVSPNQDLAVLETGTLIPFPEGVTHQILSGESLASIAAAVAALPALNDGGTAYTVSGLVNANLAATGIFNPAETADFANIQYTTLAGDTLNLICARWLLRGGGQAALNAVSGLDTAVQNLLLLNPSITDPAAQIAAGTTVNLTAAGAIYTSVADDTLTLIAGYTLTDASAFVTALLKLPQPAGLNTDPNAVQATGTTPVAVPPVTRAFDTGDTIGNLAGTLITTQDVIVANLTGPLASAKLLAPQGVMQVPLQYQIAANDTFSGIAAKLAVPLDTLAIAAAPVANLFAASAAITVSDVASITVGNLTTNVAPQSQWSQAPSMVSRFLLSGLRLPDPNDSTFQNLSAEQLQNPVNLAGIHTDAMFVLTGQQYTLPNPIPTGYGYTLTNSAGVSWLTFAQAFPYPLSADQTAMVATIDSTPMAVVQAQFQTLTRLALFQMQPPRIALQNHITWQAAAPPLSGGATGNPSIWLFPDSLVEQIEAAPSSQMLYEVVVARQSAADAPVNAAEAQSYAWGTIVDFNITLPGTDGPSTAAGNTYVIDGADDAGAALLQAVFTYLKNNPNDSATLYLLYSPGSTSANSSGLVSDVLAPATYILQTNLSTVTNSGNLMNLRAAAAPQVSPFAAPVTSQQEFLTLLWQASITRSGGYYLTYFNQNGNAALPPTVFGDSPTATISVLVLLQSQLSSIDSTLQPFNNCAVVADNIDTSSSNVFVQPAIYTVPPAVTLVSATETFNGLWQTDLQPLDVATLNATTPNLLIVGAQVPQTSGGYYTILSTDTLGSLMANNNTLSFDAISLTPILLPGAAVTPPTGKPAATVPPGSTLVSATNTFNALWHTTFQPFTVARFNSAVPQLLMVGAQIPQIGGGNYTIQYNDTLGSLMANANLAFANISTLPILEPGSPMQFAAGVLQPSTTVPPGTAGFELVRQNPDPTDAPWPVPGPALVGSLYNMVGFEIAAAGNFLGSGTVPDNLGRFSSAALPTMPADAPLLAADGLTPLPPGAAPQPLWYYSQAMAVAPFGQTQQAMGSDALPQAAANPYNGIGVGSNVTINLQLQDSYGNIQPLASPFHSVQAPVGYYDDIVSLGSWPSLAISYTVSGSNPAIDLAMSMQQARYIPSPGVSATSSIASIAADLTSYTTIFYQVAQPDLKFSLQTTLDTNTATTAYGLSNTPFTAFAAGAWIYLSALSTLKLVQISGDGGTTTVGAVCNAYGVTAAQLFTANQNRNYLSLFHSGALAVPEMYVTVSNDSLSTIAANAGSGAVSVAIANQTVPLAAGADFARTGITIKVQPADSLASAAQASHASPSGLALANPKLVLAPNTVFAVGTSSYTTGNSDTFPSVALALHATVEAVAQQNQWLKGIFVTPFQLTANDLMSQTGDTLESLAAVAGLSVTALVQFGANAGVANLFAVSTALLVGTNSSPTTPAAADTLSTYATANKVTVAQLGAANAANANAVFITNPAVTVEVPGVLANGSAGTSSTYTAQGTDTLVSIAGHFGVQPVVIAVLNASTPGLLAGSQTITDQPSGKQVITADNTTLYGVIGQFAAEGVNVPLAQLATDIVSQTGLVVANSQWICTSFCTYTAGPNDTLAGIAARFNKQPVDIAELNLAMPGLLIAGQTISDATSGKSVQTGASATLAGVVGQFAAAGAIVTISQLANDIATQPGLIAGGSLWIATPMPGNANGQAASGSISDLAKAYNILIQTGATAGQPDVVTLGTANAAAIGFLAPNRSLTISGVPVTTNQNETLNSLVNRAALQGVTVSLTDVLNQIGSLPGVVNPAASVVAVPPPSPAGNGHALSANFPSAIFQIAVNVISKRDQNLVDPDFTGNSSVWQSVYGVAPEPDPNNTSDPNNPQTPAFSLTDFATLLQTSLPGLQVATGDPVAEGDAVTGSTIWGVNFGSPHGAQQITYQFNGANTQYYAIPPLSTSLMGGSPTITGYEKGKGLTGPTAAQTFQSVDLDSWLSSFLSAVDLFLSPAYAAGAYQLAPALVTDVVESKQNLAGDLAATLAYILNVNQGGSPADAVTAMTQELLLQLSSAFSIDTLVQVPVTVGPTFTDPVTAPRISGKIEIAAQSNAGASSTPSAFSFSTAKVPMAAPAATANFTLSVKSVASNKDAKLQLNFVVTEMEVPSGPPDADGFQASSWLKFVTPLDNTNSAIGPVDIPIPLRFYPGPVTLVSQTARQSYAQPAAGNPAIATELLAWDYNFVYTHDDAEQDTPIVVVQLNTAEPVPANNNVAMSPKLQLIFGALAQFTAAWPLLKEDLALLPGLPPSGANSTPAFNAVTAFQSIVGGVAAAFSSNTLGLAGPVWPSPQVYAYQLEKKFTDNQDLATLTMTSVDIQGLPASTVLFPNVFVTPPNSAEEQLSPVSQSGRQAVYAYPTGENSIPAAAQVAQRFQFEIFPGPDNPPPALEQRVAAPQSYTFNQVNALMNQSAFAGVSISRNLMLVSGNSGNALPTNPAFIYQTPLSNFQSLAVPFIYANNEIALPPAATVGASLSAFLNGLLINGQNVWPAGTQLEMRIAVAYSYVLATTPGTRELGGLVPIVLVPNVQFAPATDIDSIVSQLQTIITNWYDNPANKPARTQGASYVFDITIFASGGNSQPLIRASTCRYQVG